MGNPLGAPIAKATHTHTHTHTHTRTRTHTRTHTHHSTNNFPMPHDKNYQACMYSSTDEQPSIADTTITHTPHEQNTITDKGPE